MSWLGAMQSQDYAGAKWAIGLRADVTDEDVERACDEGAIIRTHILRQTWHFVARDDIRWMLALSGPRVNAVNAHYYRKMELDERTFSRSRTVIERALRDGQHLTRPELKAALARARIVAEGPRLAFLIMRAELDAVICSGPRRGNQLTYALLDERVPPAKPHGPRRRAGGAGAPVLRQSRAGDAEGLRVVVRADRARRQGGHRSGGVGAQREEVDGFTYWSVGGPAPKAAAIAVGASPAQLRRVPDCPQGSRPRDRPRVR